MKKSNLFLLLLLIYLFVFITCLELGEQRGPDDLYASEIFGFAPLEHFSSILGLNAEDMNEIKNLYKPLSVKFHPDKYRGPSQEEIYKIITEAYRSLNESFSSDSHLPLNPIIRNSKEIFYNYIKPYLDELKNMTAFDKVISKDNKLESEFENLQKDLPVNLKDIGQKIVELKAVLRKANNDFDFITKTLSYIKNYQYKELPSNKIKEFLDKVNEFKPISEENVKILINKAEEKIKPLEPIWYESQPIIFLEGLLNHNEEIEKIFNNLFHSSERINISPFKFSMLKTIVIPLLNANAINFKGEITSYEEINSLMLEYLSNLKKNEYFKEEDPQAKSLLKEIEEMHATYTAKLAFTRGVQTLSYLSLTLEILANIMH